MCDTTAFSLWPLDSSDALSGQHRWYPTSREKRARCGAPVLRQGIRGVLSGDEKTIRDGRFVRFLALVQNTVAALPPLVIGNGLKQMDAAEIWPEAFGNVDLGISHLPQQKI